jgi:hypothetical protein
MAKIAGLKGRSPETYPSPKNEGIISTQSSVNTDAVTLNSVAPFPTPLLTAPIDVSGGAVVMYSGAVSGDGVDVTVSLVVGIDIVYTINVEATAANSPAPFSLVFEIDDTDGLPISIVASGPGAIVAADGSVVVIANNA